MIGSIQAAHLLLDDGWASPGHVVVNADGEIADAAAGAVAGADLELPGYVVPGIANLHSHAHHRGLVGYGDRLAPGSVATLWTWRETMYRHLLGLDPDDLEAYATLAYIEMLHRGYTAVGEFHYLHDDPEGRRYANPAEMSERIIAAARSAGIALTLLPALYTAGGVGKPPEDEQRRFTTAWGRVPVAAGDRSTGTPRMTHSCASAPHPTACVPSTRPSSRPCSPCAPPARFTSMPPSAPRRWPRWPQDSARARSSGWSQTPVWTRAGA